MSLSTGLIVCLLIIILIGVSASLFSKETNLTIVIVDHRDHESKEEKIINEENNMEEIDDTQYILPEEEMNVEINNVSKISYDTSETSEEVNQALGLFLKDISAQSFISEEKSESTFNKAVEQFSEPLPEPPPENANGNDILFADRNIAVDEHFEATLQNIDQLATTIVPSEYGDELESLLGDVTYNPKNQKTEMTIHGKDTVITVVGMDGQKGRFIVEGSYIQPRLFGVESYDQVEVDIAEVS